MRDRFQRQEFLAVMIPSMMPPPAPWKIFVFASGVFEMRVAHFLLAVFVGRMVRWLVLSLLVLKLGPGAVDLVARHALPTVMMWACWRCSALRGGGCGRSAAGELLEGVSRSSRRLSPVAFRLLKGQSGRRCREDRMAPKAAAPDARQHSGSGGPWDRESGSS